MIDDRLPDMQRMMPLEFHEQMIVRTRAHRAITTDIGLLVAVESVDALVMQKTQPMDSLARVAFSFNLRHIRRRDFAPIQLVPVDFRKPTVREDVGRAGT